MNPRIPQIIADLVQFESNLRQLKSTQEIANQLASIKAYAAELYLETDMEIIAQSASSVSKVPEPIEEVAETQTLFKPTYEDDVDVTDGEEIDNSEILTIDVDVRNETEIHPTSDELETVNASNLTNASEDNPKFDISTSEESITERLYQSKDEVIPEELEISLEKDNRKSEKELQKSQDDYSINEEEESLNSFETNNKDLFSNADESVDNKTDGLSNIEGKKHLEQRANEILSMFSFSRRFEFGNFLFGGDMKLFAVFISEMLAAGNSEEREDVFDNWYNERQWSRRDESANDLKRNLRKML